MFCTLHKWFISRSMDRAEPLPRLVARHVSRCPACARFAQQCREMASRLGEEAGREAISVSPELHEKILRRCRPASESSGESAVRIRPLRLRRPAVVLAAAAALVLAVVGVYLYSRSQPTSQPPPAPLVEQRDIEPPPWFVTPEIVSAKSAAMIENALQQPIEEEIHLLRRDGKAAAEFLLACIPLDLDPRERESSPPTQPALNGG